MGRILLLTVFAFLFISTISESKADVLIEDVRINSTQDQNFTFTTAPIETGAGQEGNYEIVACAVSTPNGGAVFSTPTPNGWTQLDNGLCGGIGICSLGIWGRFTDTAASESVDCSWVPGGNVFAAGSFKYSNVDPIDPIIEIACDSGIGFGTDIIATAPSVFAEPGSMIVAFWVFRNFDQSVPENQIDTSELPQNATLVASELLTFTNIVLLGASVFSVEAGETGEGIANAGLDAEWRACTLTLRMTVQQRNVPTLNEWGLMAFAALAGITGFWFVRRRQITT